MSSTSRGDVEVASGSSPTWGMLLSGWTMRGDFVAVACGVDEHGFAGGGGGRVGWQTFAAGVGVAVAS